MSARPILRLFLRLLLALLAWLAILPARADTAVALYQSFRGTVNFVGTEATLRTADNGRNACTLVSSSTGVYATLSGIPSGAKIISAQLYWAGSGISSNADYTVTFDGVSVTAGRKFTSNTIGNGFSYFSGAADVTTQVSKKGNGSYSFSGLTVSTGNPWCASQGVLGGFSLVVVYSHANEPFRMLNLYEGFQYFQNNGFTIDLGNFNVPNPLPSTVTGRIGHITWEGDSTLSQGGESLLFNKTELTDSLNPSGNQFNSASNATGDSASYGVDFDIYTLKSPTITAGQSTASTTYKSGQDLVLLSAEIVAMPYVANADLALSMTRTGDLKVGSTAYYTLTVTNNGVDAEVGPVTVVDTLPSGLKLVSTSGSGWTCTSAAGANSTTVVTCTQAGPVAAGATMSALTLTVTPNATGTYNNTATVSGKTGDNNAANNTASNSSTAIDTGSAAVVFTTEVCKNGDPIVTAPGDVGCHRFIGPIVAGATTSKIYLTQVNGANRAGAISSYDTTVSVDIKANCLPYNAAVKLNYAGLSFDCQGENWQTLKVTVPAGKPTATLPDNWTVSYNDVGRISLSLRYNGFVMGTVNFVSRPYDLRFRSVLRVADGILDLKGTTADSFGKSSPIAFAKAGEPFILRVGALMANGGWAPSFGKEPDALKNVPDAGNVALVFSLDKFAANPLASPVKPITVKDADNQDVSADGIAQGAFVLDQDFALNTAVDAGSLDARARYFEAGYLAVTPILADYLGTGQVGGPPDGVDPLAKERLVTGTRVIGHFYPDHFETEMVAAFACAPTMTCPAVSTDAAKPTYPVEGAVYSTQPFKLTVTAFGLPKGTEAQPLSLFRNLAGSTANANIVGGTTFRNVTLSAVGRPLDGGPTLTGSLALVPANSFPASSSPLDPQPMTARAAYTLAGAAFTASDRSGQTKWGAPEIFYLRAGMKERLVTDNATVATKDIVVSSATPAATPALQYEDGLMVVGGRLFVPNAFGSELLRLPLAVSAQYWSGSAWLVSSTDSDSVVAQTLAPVKCTRAFAASCTAASFPLASAGAGVRLNNGTARVFLQSPGRGNVGSVDFTLGSSLAPWLPSTRGRATFGLYKSSLIYLREVY